MNFKVINNNNNNIDINKNNFKKNHMENDDKIMMIKNNNNQNPNGNRREVKGMLLLADVIADHDLDDEQDVDHNHDQDDVDDNDDDDDDDDDNDDEDIINICHLNENYELEELDDENYRTTTTEQHQQQQPSGQRWDPLGADDDDDHDHDHDHHDHHDHDHGDDDADHDSHLMLLKSQSQNELLNFNDLNRIKVLEDEQEMLSTSLLALTTHFAQVQFRLRQIVDAPINDRDNLLASLEEFAFRGIPPPSTTKTTTTTTTTSTTTMTTSDSSGSSSSIDSSKATTTTTTTTMTTTTKSMNKNTKNQSITDDDDIPTNYLNRNHHQLKLIEQLKMDLLRVENKNKNKNNQHQQQHHHKQHHHKQHHHHKHQSSSETETEMETSKTVLMNEFNDDPLMMDGKLITDQQNQQSHQMELLLIEKQKLIIDELTNKLKLNVNINSKNDYYLDLTKLSTDALRLQIDQAIGEFVGPIKMKETLVAQLKTQILDLERFVSHLQCETINTKVLLRQLIQTNNNIKIMTTDDGRDDRRDDGGMAAASEDNENLRKNSTTFEKVKLLLNKNDDNKKKLIKRNSSIKRVAIAAAAADDGDGDGDDENGIIKNQEKLESSIVGIADEKVDGDDDDDDRDDDGNKYFDSDVAYATYNSKMAQDRLRSTIQSYDELNNRQAIDNKSRQQKNDLKNKTTGGTINKSFENNERIESKADEKSTIRSGHQRRHSIGTPQQTKTKPTKISATTSTTTSIISKASTLMSMFTLMQFGCGSASSANANSTGGPSGILKKDNSTIITNTNRNNRSANHQNFIKNFRKNTLKTTMKGNHWGDLRAQLEIDVQEIIMLLSATKLLDDETFNGTGTGTGTGTKQLINLNRHQKYHQEYHQRKLKGITFNHDKNNNHNNKSHKNENPIDDCDDDDDGVDVDDDDDDLSEDCYCFQNINNNNNNNNNNNQKQSNKYKRQQLQHQQMELITLVRKHFAMTLKKLMEHGLRGSGNGGGGAGYSTFNSSSSSSGLIVPFIECFLSNSLAGTTAVTNHYDYDYSNQHHNQHQQSTTTSTNNEWIMNEEDIGDGGNDNKMATSSKYTLKDYHDNNNNSSNNGYDDDDFNSTTATTQMHIWDFILEYYYIKNGDKLNETPARCLSQSFNLEITDSNTLMTPPPPSQPQLQPPSSSMASSSTASSNIKQQQQQQHQQHQRNVGKSGQKSTEGNQNILSSQFITNKQSLLYGIGNIIEMHRPYKRSQNAHFKAFISAGLNAKRLTQWLHLIYQNHEFIQMYYTEWSYASRTGFKDAIKTIDKLAEFQFDLPIDLAIRQFKNIKDIFL